MLNVFPRKISNTAIYLYFGSLALVTIIFRRYAMPLKFMIFGIFFVVGFFLMSSHLSQRWKDLPQKTFVRNLLLVAFGLREAWVLFSYFFYTHETGIPFEYHAADSMGYWDDSAWLAYSKWATIKDYLFTSRNSVSDSGYVFYLAMLGKIISPQYIILTRTVKAVWSMITVLMVYRLAQRSLGEETGRLAAIFTCLFPNLIVYSGLHLKETEMIFLLMFYLERLDKLLRSDKFNLLNLILPVLLAVSLFTFRTALGVVAIFAAVTALVFSTVKVVGRWRRVLLIAWGGLAIATFAGGTIGSEVEEMWEGRLNNQEQRRSSQVLHGSRWVRYATGTVMAPMSFVQPFPTMVRSEMQEQQNLLHGGNYVRDVLGIFVIIGVFASLFLTKNWRDLSLILGFTIAYLVVISSSAFAGAERFLLPVAPCLMIFAAHGVVQLDAKRYRWVQIWYYVLPVICLAWAYFKLGNKGLL